LDDIVLGCIDIVIVQIDNAIAIVVIIIDGDQLAVMVGILFDLVFLGDLKRTQLFVSFDMPQP